MKETGQSDMALVVSLLKRCPTPTLLGDDEDGWRSVVLGCAIDAPPDEVAALLRVLDTP